MTTTVSPSALAGEIRRAGRRRGAARALILDLDGTLAPIVPDPRRARVPKDVLAILERLVDQGWRIAVVSGRPAAEARARVPLAGVSVFGSHGIENDVATPVSHALRAAARRAARVARDARPLAAAFPGSAIESKPFGCAFHYRALDARLRPRFLNRLATWLAAQDLRGLEQLSGHRVLELRPAGYGKQLVVRRWPAARGRVRIDHSLVAIGDDRTDEDLFAAIEPRGLTVSVGPKGKTTRARRALTGTAAVARALAMLAAGGGGA